MAYEKIVSVPSTATSGQVPQADGVGGFSWGAVDAYTKAQTLTEATKVAYGLDASAVPDDVFNAVKGLLGGGAKIATGSYVGTGTYGASNPCSLTFDFIPKIVVISQSSNMSIFNVWYYNTSSGIYPYNTAYNNKFTLNGNTLSWYNAKTDEYVEQYQIQLNEFGKTYAWFAAG